MPRARSIAASATAIVIVLATLVFARDAALPPPGSPPPPDAVVWESVNWIRGEPAGLNGAGSVLYEARRSESGILAWGEGLTPAPDGAAVRGMIWTSPDGASWNAIPLPRDGPMSFIPNVVAAGDGGYLAFGRKGLIEASSAIVSADGTAWFDAAMPAAVDAPPLLIASGREFLSAGVRADRPVAWSSVEGRVWVEEAVPAPPGQVALEGLHATTAGVFLTGRVQAARDWDALIWIRQAGVWVPLGANDRGLNAPGRSASATRVISFAGGLLAIGWAGKLDECQLGVGRLAMRGPIVADHCPGLPPAAWVSADGQQWRSVRGPRPPGAAAEVEAYVGDIGAGGEGLIGMFDEPDQASGDWRLGVWTSADGQTWRRIANGMDRGDAYPQAQLVTPDRLIVLGETDDGRLIVWLGEPIDLP